MKFDISYLLSGKYAQWIIISVCTLFFILILMELSSLFMIRDKIDVIPKPPSPTEQSQTDDKIIYSSLFGDYVPVDLNEADIKQSMLNVELVGILLADNMEDSQVIIRDAGGEEHNYRIGDPISGGAVIKRIMVDAVVVEHDGSLERLNLIKDELTFEPAAKPLIEE